MKQFGIGYYELSKEPIVINQRRESVTIKVTNSGKRTIQIGSHFHFFEVNENLLFPREKAYGLHLDIPSGTSVRWIPGSSRTVQLTGYAGEQKLYGFNGLVNGKLWDESVRDTAMKKAKEKYGLGVIRDE